MKTMQEAVDSLMALETVERIQRYLTNHGFKNEPSFAKLRCLTCPLALYFLAETGEKWSIAGATAISDDSERFCLPEILVEVQLNFDKELK